MPLLSHYLLLHSKGAVRDLKLNQILFTFKPNTGRADPQHVLELKDNVLLAYVSIYDREQPLCNSTFFKHEELKYNLHLKCCQVRKHLCQKILQDFSVKLHLHLDCIIHTARRKHQFEKARQ